MVSVLVCAGARVRRLCVRACVYALRIVSTGKSIRFINVSTIAVNFVNNNKTKKISYFTSHVSVHCF